MVTTLTRSFVTFAALLSSAAALAQVPPILETATTLYPLSTDCIRDCDIPPTHFVDPLFDFGKSVGLTGDVALMGIPHQGSVAVFAFDRSQQTWQRSGSLISSDGTDNGFGRTIATGKYKALVGASGTAYLFNISTTHQTQTAKLQPTTADPAFGAALAYSGLTAAVGVPSSAVQGSVYVYETDGAGQVVATVTLTASDGAPGDGFGKQIALQDDTLAIAGTSNGTPAVYVFRRNGATWTQEQTIPRSADTYQFGNALALLGPNLIVGSPQGPDQRGGVVYRYHFEPGSGWTLAQTLVGPPTDGFEGSTVNFSFGYSMAADPVTSKVAIGTTWGLMTGADERGLVYLYDLTPNGLIVQGRSGYRGLTVQLALSGTTLLKGPFQGTGYFAGLGHADVVSMVAANACTRVAPITVDGNASDWVGVPPHTLSTNNAGHTEGSVYDAPSHFRVQWDENNLYVLVEVQDDVLAGTSTGVYDNDSVELYVDAGFERASTYDPNDYQLIVDWRGVRGGVHSENIDYASAVATNATGYTVEYSIPWNELGYTGAVGSHAIGLDIAINDNDRDPNSGITSRNGQKVWHGDGTGWFNPSVFAAFALNSQPCGGIDGSVCRRSSSSPVTVDGNANDWPAILNGAIRATDAVAGHPATAADVSGNFSLQWDDSNLYALVRVTDDIVGGNQGQVYDNDAVELYIDGGNEHSATYDSNDFQLSVDRNGARGGVRSDQLTFQSSVTTAPTSYVVEYAVPWSQIGVAATAGKLFGLDVAINDADAVVPVRESQIAWHGNGEGWFDTTTFARFQLGAATCLP